MERIQAWFSYVNQCGNLDSDTANKPIYATTLYGIPQSAITRKSRVMGTVWTFNLSHQYSFQLLCISRMIERFGQDDCNWLLVELAIDKTTQEHHQQQQRSGSRANRLSIIAIPSAPEGKKKKKKKSQWPPTM